MNLEPSARAEEFRTTVREFIEASVPPGWAGLGALSTEEAEQFVESWRTTLAEAGLLAVTWPPQYGGRGLGLEERMVLLAELSRAGLPDGGLNDPFSIGMLGNTVLEHGTDEQRATLLPRLMRGEDRWCQGFSEPGAGSDLAGITTAARLEGGEWRINGQKVWTTSAHTADHIFVLCRTAPAEPKRHAGLTMLLCDMRQPGVEVRPITMLSGASEFNEVFFTDARVPADDVLGEVGGGWAVAMTLLGFERGENLPGLALRHQAELERLVEHLRRTGRIDDPEIRVRLARLHAAVQATCFLGDRVVTRLLRGEDPGAAAAVAKLHLSETHTALVELAVDAFDDPALAETGRPPHAAFHIDDPGDPLGATTWLHEFLHSQGELIAAGTSEVQRNIIAERVLGLPK